jgi:hypothetical protein
MTTLHVGAVPLHAPLQPVKVLPGESGVAVSWTWVFHPYDSAQSSGPSVPWDLRRPKLGTQRVRLAPAGMEHERGDGEDEQADGGGASAEAHGVREPGADGTDPPRSARGYHGTTSGSGVAYRTAPNRSW